jgi:hypothetical protein
MVAILTLAVAIGANTAVYSKDAFAADCSSVSPLDFTDCRHELGIRLALGAAPKQILRLVIGNGMALVGLGIGLGFLFSLVLPKLVAASIEGAAALVRGCALLGEAGASTAVSAVSVTRRRHRQASSHFCSCTFCDQKSLKAAFCC